MVLQPLLYTKLGSAAQQLHLDPQYQHTLHTVHRRPA